MKNRQAIELGYRAGEVPGGTQLGSNVDQACPVEHHHRVVTFVEDQLDGQAFF